MRDDDCLLRPTAATAFAKIAPAKIINSIESCSANGLFNAPQSSIHLLAIYTDEEFVRSTKLL